ncbi:MAG: hypothetical protein KDG54_20970, partial [Geminicoccaceae bacterium]|nr:hypothetical protein [Geminicoccaceae bacterium]
RSGGGFFCFFDHLFAKRQSAKSKGPRAQSPATMQRRDVCQEILREKEILPGNSAATATRL